MQEEGYDMWFCCDKCMQPIPEGMYHFDSTKLDNYTLCLKCYKKNKTITHKFTKGKVPRGQGPPQNSEELIAKAFMVCSECKESLLDLSKRVYYCPTTSNLKTGDVRYWCKDCYGKTEWPHKREKLKGGMVNPFTGTNEKLSSTDKKKYVDNLFEEYHNLDFEDVIGGGTVKTRFRYANVAREDFGLNDEEILLLDDSKLNQLVSLKNYRPYRDVENDAAAADGEEPLPGRKRRGVNVYAVMNKKKEFRNELNEKLDMVKKIEEANLEDEKAKHLKTKVRDDKKLSKKEKLLKKRKHKERGEK